MPNIETSSNNEQKPCRTCVDFKTWAKQQRRTTKQLSTEATTKAAPQNETGRSEHGCPLDKDELGRSTWGLLHTMAATYPDSPTPAQSEDMASFFGILSRSYPCDVCAKDLAQELKQEPINAGSNHELSQWLCRLHNKVNDKLGKPIFDCSKVNERWKNGWLDGSCD